jgi:hypothetical protein
VGTKGYLVVLQVLGVLRGTWGVFWGIAGTVGY